VFVCGHEVKSSASEFTGRGAEFSLSWGSGLG
jgi:hypothetical protein